MTRGLLVLLLKVKVLSSISFFVYELASTK
jgi:hypothetical protein